jgi:hypothetical protein
MTPLRDRIAAQERRALRMHETYTAAIGRPAVAAAPVEPVAEWIRRAQESRLVAKEYAR